MTWDSITAKNLGLHGLTEAQLKLMAGLITTKPVAACEAALALLHIPIVEMSEKVTFVNAPMPGRTKVFMSNAHKHHKGAGGVIDKYVARPDSKEHMTFTEYFAAYSIEKHKPASYPSLERDKTNSFLVPRKGLVRFNDPHPSEHTLSRASPAALLPYHLLTDCLFFAHSAPP